MDEEFESWPLQMSASMRQDEAEDPGWRIREEDVGQ
jgi:hypothetical protein